MGGGLTPYNPYLRVLFLRLTFDFDFDPDPDPDPDPELDNTTFKIKSRCSLRNETLFISNGKTRT